MTTSPATILHEALQRSDPRDRAAYLNEACGEDADLRAEVERLVRAHAAAGDFLNEPAVTSAETLQADSVIAEGPGTEIDRYKLLQKIGEGGFGVVYMAEQREPVRRKVALKIIKLGMDTKQVIARFEAERQALAMMDHPNIAKVLDAGATSITSGGGGRPYFVMELVKGEPITEYCDKHNLDVTQRLELFQQVCHAVQHAHQKGVIHRDIKPSNVMITLHDGKPVPKVIDFGIAKATNARLTEKTVFTEYRQFIGTPEYMSPEQAEMSGLDIDTRSDVYSLGVLLYELLTGVTPFDGKKLRSAGYGEIQRIIREETPSKPSTRLSELSRHFPSASLEHSSPGSGQQGEGILEPSPSGSGQGEGSSHSSDEHSSIDYIAKHRHTDPASLSRALRGDLDWIVMKALEKDRQRRYETANGFAMDIERYLNDEPVTAGPPTIRYRMRKFIRRNKGAFSAAAVLFVVLSVGLIGTTWGLTEALAARQAEQERAEELELVADFQSEQLSNIDVASMGLRWREDLLASVRTVAERSRLDSDAIENRVDQVEALIAGADFTGMALTALEETVFIGALDAIDTQFGAQPLVQARLLQTIAKTMRELALLEQAIEPQERALAIRRSALGDDHPHTLISISEMGLLLRSQGKFTEAEPYHREALEGQRRVLGNEHPDTLASINNMGFLLQVQSAYAEAESYYLEALESCRRVLGDDHPDTLTSITNMGSLLREQGKYAEALPYYRESLETRRRILGDEHADTLISISDMGLILKLQGSYAEAEPYYHEALAGCRRTLGNEHPHTLISVSNMGVLLRSQSKYTEAEPYYQEALASFRRILGDEHRDTLISISNMGFLRYSQGRYTEAEPYFREVLETRRRILGDEHADTLVSLNNMGLLLQAQGKLTEAEAHYREALDGFRRVVGDEHPRTLTSINNMGFVLQAQGEPEEAAAYYREALEVRRRILGDAHPSTLVSINNMGAILRDLGRLAKAQALGAEAVDRGRAALSENHWRVGLFLRQHAATLAAMQRYSGAEERALAAHTTLQAALGPGHDRTRKAVETIIDLYEQWHEAEPAAGYDAKAAEWRARLQPAEAPQDE